MVMMNTKALPPKPSTQLAVAQPEVRLTMDTLAGFEALQRAAKLFNSSELVPQRYQGPKGFPNCVIALEMAARHGSAPLMVMQNLYIVHGTPAWSAQYLIGTFNACGRFSALRYEQVGEPGKPGWKIRAWATELSTKEKLQGAWISWETVEAEGWSKKAGSKWLTMPEQMGQYRAAAWFIRTHAPELSLGIRGVVDGGTIVDLEPSQYTVDNGPAAQGPTIDIGPAQPANEPAQLPEQTASVDEWDQLALDMVSFEGDPKAFAREFSARVGKAPPDRKEALLEMYKANREARS